MTKLENVIDRWNTGKDVTLRHLIELNAQEREAFFAFLSPANEPLARKLLQTFLNAHPEKKE